ncbi:MAG: glycosyltransferase WbuB [Candidatus Viridilinea halotolerans]|uniref:Glycosyltransferase WbuB n=1 Tax=Candidatus Viridilinea halotolerans TaxID=2491704 RepID=A0A426UC50_9CHLR|nr:MAG: glycosyltransferase WbuB [Candidatus Viridilinea halotolerans]
MHTLIVTAIYPPEPVVSAQTSAQLAEGLRERGHCVTVITSFPNRPAGRLFPGFRRRWVQRERTATGVTLLRCFATLAPQSRLLSRLLENLSFGLTSAWQVSIMPKPDVIYANTWPLVATGLLALVATWRAIPLVISVQDVYPEALVAQQRMAEHGLLVRFLRWLDRAIAHASSHVVVISPHFARIYHEQRCLPRARLSLVPNWVAAQPCASPTAIAAYRQQQHLAKQTFLIVYGGNVGVAAGVEQVITALQSLDDLPDLRLLIAGAGSRLHACQQLAAMQPMQRVLFHTPWATPETTTVLGSADLLVLPTQREQSLASVPSKLLAYMLAGRPVLATALPHSDLANIIMQAGCGWVVAPDRPDILAAQIRAIAQLSAVERQQRGAAGRRYVLAHLTSDVCVPQIVQILEQNAKEQMYAPN